jgi:hypothetical protein
MCFCFGISNLGDTPFSKFGVDSNKTPDHISFVISKGFYLILEFTVTKNFDKGLENKLGFHKYDKEVSELKEKGFNVFDNYLVLPLSGGLEGLFDQMYWISKKVGEELPKDYQESLLKMQYFFNTLEFVIKSHMPELLLQNDFDIKLDLGVQQLDSDKTYGRTLEQGSVGDYIDEVKLKLVIKNYKKLQRSFGKHAGENNFKIYVEVYKQSVYVKQHTDGKPKRELLDMVHTRNQELVKYIILDQRYHSMINLTEDNKIEPENFRVKRMITDYDDSSFLNRFSKLDLSEVNLLSNSETSESLRKGIEAYHVKLATLSNDERVLKHNRPPTVMPIFKNVLGRFTTEILDPFISKIARGYNGDRVVDYTMVRAKFEKSGEVLSRLGKLGDELRKSLGSDKLSQISRSKHDKIKELVSDDQQLEKVNEFLSLRKENNDLLKSIRKSGIHKKRLTKDEYKEFKNTEFHSLSRDKGRIKTFECLNFDSLDNKIRLFYDFLFSRCTESTVEDNFPIFENTGLGLKKQLDDFKDEILKFLNEHYDGTIIQSILKSWSKVAYSILYFSQITSSKEEFFIENAGLSDVVICVKGGKKIVSTKYSRFVSIYAKVPQEALFLYEGTSCKFYSSLDGTFVKFPWRQYKFEVLKMLIELPYRFESYMIGSCIENEMRFEDFKPFITTKIFAMLNQRRKLEVWLGFFRYIYFNSTSVRTSYDELFLDMADFDHDMFFYYFQRKFLLRIKEIYKGVQRGVLIDLISEGEINNMDLCVEKYDEHIFMAKAPFNSKAEYYKNVRSVLSTHSEFTDKYGDNPDEILKETDVRLDSNASELFEDDFKFSSESCFVLGNFISEYISRTTSSGELQSALNNIVNSDFSDIANSKGMRDFDSTIWGLKGHQVVSKHLDYSSKVTEFIKNFPKDPKTFEKQISSGFVSFQEVTRHLDDPLRFDLDSKVQYKGSREIYTMDFKTKARQQILERFFKILCSKLPNELIHKSSDIRPKYIHSKLFSEEHFEEVTYSTLDCRKWAPKSNLWKYYYFVQGMSGFLPQEFVSFFNQFWKLMFKKRLYFKKGTIKYLTSNPNTKHFLKYFVLDLDSTKNVNGGKVPEDLEESGVYYIVMPYSFMMGIFNYLSSLMHAASQLYFAEKIASPRGVSFQFMAHSDDSGGICISKSQERNISVMGLYEVYQKSLNHLLSKKKSQISEISFEIISINYYKKRYLPMTHKFFNNVQINLSGKGWATDINNVTSKVIEVHSNGGTLFQCYVVQCYMNEMYRRIYHLPNSPNLSKVPIAFGGVYMGHPMHSIMLGGSNQEKMLDLLEDEESRKFRIYVYFQIAGTYVRNKGASIKYRLPYRMRPINRLELDEEEKRLLDAFCIIPRSDTFSRQAQYYNNLYESSFNYSLSGVESEVLFLSSVFLKNSILVSDRQLVDLKTLCEYYLAKKLVDLETPEIDVGNFDYEIVKDNYYYYISSSESIRVEGKDYDVNSYRSCKPVTYNTVPILGVNMSYKDVSSVVAYNKDQRIANCFYSPERFEKVKNWILLNIPGNQVDKLDILETTVRKDFESFRSSYIFLPSGLTIDTPENFVTYNLLYNSRKYRLSNKKPQFYTIEPFSPLHFVNDSLRHFYLAVKAYNRNYTSVKNPEELVNCVAESFKSCKYCTSDQKGNWTEYMRIQSINDMETTTTHLPICKYLTSQWRGKTNWFGNCDFEILSDSFSVYHRQDGSEQFTEWSVEDESYLSYAYSIYKLFAESRGISIASPSIEFTPLSFKMLALTDSLQARMSNGNSFETVLPNSKVMVRSISPPEIEKRGNKFYHRESVVDFDLLNITGINETFYKKHMLSELKDFLLPKEKLIVKDDLLKFMSRSKLAKILSCDDMRGNSSVESKISHSELLGSELSFSRALYESDVKGVTKFRSNLKPYLRDEDSLEFVTIKDMPILDLISSTDISRLNYREYKVLNKIINGTSINSLEKKLLLNVRNKLGISSMNSTMVLLKHARRISDYRNLLNLPSGEKEAIFRTMLNCINNMEDVAENKDLGVKSLLSDVYFQMHSIKYKNTLVAGSLADCMIYLYKHNPQTFYNLCRDNYTVLAFDFSERNLFNIRGLFSLLIRSLGFDWLESELLNMRSYQLIKRKFRDLDMLEDEESEMEMVPVVIKFGTGKLFDSYMLEDAEDFMDEYDDFEDREYEGEEVGSMMIDDEAHVILYNYNYYTKFVSEVCKIDFPYIKVLTIKKWNLTFLGPHDIEVYKHEGIDFYRYHFHPRGSIREVNRVRPEVDDFTPIEFKEIQPIEPLLGCDTLSDYMKDKGINNPTLIDLISRSMIRETFHHDYNILDEDHLNFLLQSVMKEWDQVEKMIERSLELIFKKNFRYKSSLPGFTKLLIDDTASSELKTIFGSNYTHIISGCVYLTKDTRDFLVRDILMQWKESDIDKRVTLDLLLAILKEVQIYHTSDSWFFDSVMYILNKYKVEQLEHLIETVDLNINYSELSGTLEYKTVYEYYEDSE